MKKNIGEWDEGCLLKEGQQDGVFKYLVNFSKVERVRKTNYDGYALEYIFSDSARFLQIFDSKDRRDFVANLLQERIESK